MRKIIGKKNKVHYVEETTRLQMVKSHKGWLVIGASMFALGLGVLVTSRPVSADVVATSTSSSAVNAEMTGASSSSAVNAETTSASNSSAVEAETTSANNSSAVNAETTSASSSSAVNARSEGQSKVTVHYVDKDGKELATQAYSYGYPAGSKIAAQSPDYQVAPKDITGYTLVTSDSPVSSLNGKQLTTSKAVPFLDDDQTVYYVYTKNAPTITTEKKTVNETVSYVDQNGQVLATTHTASVDFTRQVSTDAVTGEKTYGNWSAAQSFDAVKSPELKGYTADKAQIDKQTVNGDSKDLEFTVTYTKNAPTITTDLKHQLTPGNPSQPSYATNNGAVNSPELPQTGESNSQSQTMSFIGILLAMFGSLLGFLGIKKRRND